MRRAVAWPDSDGDMMDEVVAYGQSALLSEPQKVALRFHDAFLADPAGLGPAEQARILEHFSPSQIVELAFKFIWWSTNRATVTLGGDAPHDPARLTSFHYASDGEYVVHASS
jgi:alkylhydroperoxidase family enzyme